MTVKIIDEKTRARIAEFMPDAVMTAISSYHRFMKNAIPGEAKEFAAHHGACKVAIAHIELLIKLARIADLPDAGAEDHNRQIVLAGMIQEAREQVEKFYRDEGEV